MADGGIVTNGKVIAELQALAKRHGDTLRPVDVVRAARPESSALHSWFCWDDTKAAQRWRLHQARQLLRVTVAYLGPVDDQRRTRVFVSLTTDRSKGGPGYRCITKVLSDSEKRAQLLADALADMERFTERYSTLNELAEVFEAMGRSARKLKVA